MTLSEIYEAAHVRRLPVDPVEISRALGVKVVDYEAVVECFDTDMRSLYVGYPLGFSFRDGGVCCIALNTHSCGERRRRFTVAHELAHCVLRHFESKDFSYSEERAAERFAAELLAPLAVLRACGVRSAEEMARLCGISHHAARIRAEELAEREYGGFTRTADERRLTELLGEFINSYRKKR